MVSAMEQLRRIQKGAHMLVGEKELLEKLERSVSKEVPLVVKFGMDPSAPDLHLGHAVPLRKLRQMQEMGHEIVLVIGDFTGQIGDPTGKSKGRTALSREKVMENAETYCQQVFKILDKEKTRVTFNSCWLQELTFGKVLQLASSTTVARMLERDDFQSRYAAQTPIGLHEFFYPLMQAYDSVHLKADIELGGTDQTFNVLMGRVVQKEWGQEPQAALFMPILEGLDGVEKMSKSLGNYIGISEPATVMFKKVMEVPDSLILRYFELATDETPETVCEIEARLKAGQNPRDCKLRLAEVITDLYHGEEEMRKAAAYYDTAFGKKGIPADIPEAALPLGSTLRKAGEVFTEKGILPSKSEFTRLLQQGGIQKNGEKCLPENLDEPLKKGDVLRLGKKKFFRIDM